MEVLVTSEWCLLSERTCLRFDNTLRITQEIWIWEWFSLLDVFRRDKHIWNRDACDGEGGGRVGPRRRCADGPARGWKVAPRRELRILRDQRAQTLMGADVPRPG